MHASSQRFIGYKKLPNGDAIVTVPISGLSKQVRRIVLRAARRHTGVIKASLGKRSDFLTCLLRPLQRRLDELIRSLHRTIDDTIRRGPHSLCPRRRLVQLEIRGYVNAAPTRRR